MGEHRKMVCVQKPYGNLVKMWRQIDIYYYFVLPALAFTYFLCCSPLCYVRK